MLTQKDILELALDAAIDVWAEFRFLAGLDSSDECCNYRARATEKELSEAKAHMKAWDKRCKWISMQIKAIEKQERNRKKA